MKRKLFYLFLIPFLIIPSLNVDLIQANSEEIEVSVGELPEIDVALTVGSTNIEVENFEEDLTNELERKGIEPNRINIQAFETKRTSTETQDASEIFADWESRNLLPDVTNGSTTELWLGDHVTGGWEATGSRVSADETSGRPAKAWINPDVEDSDGATTISFTWGIDENNYGSFQHGEAGFIFGIEDDHNFYMYIMDNHDACGHIRFNGGEAIIKVDDGNIIHMDTHDSFPRYEPGLSQDIDIEINGNEIVIFREGEQVLSATDDSKEKINGLYGFYVWDQYGAYFEDISFTSEFKRSFNEVIRQPEWRDGSKRFIVNMENENIADFDDSQALGEILTRLTNEQIDYIGVGSNTNKEQAERFISRNNNNGVFIESDNDYNEIIEEIADYILSKIEVEQGTSSEYILVGSNLELEVSPSEYQTNTENSVYPNGRWRVDHDYQYFENNNGIYINSGEYQPDFDFAFDKVGRYELWFGDVNPEPRYLYVHRKPVASYSMEVQDMNDEYSINIQDMSYDLDLESNEDRGIAEHEWKWKETTSETWNDGQVPSSLPAGKDYVVQLRVKDHQGVWSEPEARYITTSDVVAQPIANFDMPSTALIYNPIDVNNTSYDPAGRNITETEWTVTRNGVEVYQGSEPVTDFNPYGEGRYIVSLKVKNDAGVWSEEFSRVINISVDDIAPEINVDLNEQDWTNDNITVNATFTDEGGSGFDSHRYAITNSQSPPTSDWNSWASDTSQEITLSNEGYNPTEIDTI